MRALAGLVMLVLLAACGSEAAAPADDGAAAGPVRSVDEATVTDLRSGERPRLCTSAVRESAPPQCEGPLISNWDWDKVWGAYGFDGLRWGSFCFEGKDVGDTFELTTLPRPVGTCDSQEYRARAATVLEDGGSYGPVHGPQLCLGVVLTSLPLQCGGPDIPNWDWDKVTGESRHSKTVDGVYDVHGIYVDGDFTLTRPPKAWDENDAAPETPTRDFATPCPEPEEGWFPKDRPKLDELAVDRAAPLAEKIPGYSELWLDQQFNEGTENDSNRIILNVRVTKDVKGAEAAMRKVWKGALCVSRAKHTNKELQKIQDEAGTMAKGLMLSSSSGDDRVDVDVILDEGGRLQKAFDKKYGAGTVRVTSALVEASPDL